MFSKAIWQAWSERPTKISESTLGYGMRRSWSACDGVAYLWVARCLTIVVLFAALQVLSVQGMPVSPGESAGGCSLAAQPEKGNQYRPQTLSRKY